MLTILVFGQSIQSFALALNKPLLVGGVIDPLGLVGRKPDTTLKKMIHNIIRLILLSIFLVFSVSNSHFLI